MPGPCEKHQGINVVGYGCLMCLIAERDLLVAIVQKLPKTADGVPIVPGKTYYMRSGSNGVITKWSVQICGGALECWDDDNPADFRLDWCYSTREAAIESSNGTADETVSKA